MLFRSHNEQIESEIKTKIPFILALKKLKYLSINLTKYVQDLYEEIYKTQKNKIFKKLNKWRDISCSWIRLNIINVWRDISCSWIRLNIINVSVLPKLFYRFNATPNKIPPSYFVDVDNLILKFIWRGKGHRKANTILKEQSWSLSLQDFKTYYKARVIKTMWY